MNLTFPDLSYTYSDNCGTIAASVTQDPTMFDCTMLGMNIVTVTVTDDSGNTSSCEATVNVVDTSAPNCVAMDHEVALDPNGEATIVISDIDNGSNAECGMFTLALDQTMFNCDDVGDNTVTLTVTSANGMMADCEATVTVNDDEIPEIDCIDDVTFSLNAMGDLTITATDLMVVTSDNCDLDPAVLDMTTFDCDDIGMVVVSISVSDENGNSNTCSSDVTIVDDLAPSCTINDITIAPNQSFDLSDFIYTFMDNCQSIEATASLDEDEFNCMELGANTVTLTVSDDSGNSENCTATVTVNDIDMPICSAMDITIELDDEGEYNLDPEEVDDGSTGGCDDLTYEVDIDFFACKRCFELSCMCIFNSN